MNFNNQRRSSNSMLQQRLASESAANMEVFCGEESSSDRSDHVGLSFGPYGASPLSGLHFDTADDTATS